MATKVDLAPGQFIVGGVVCDQNTPKEHIDYYMEQSNRELAMMYPYKVEPLNVGDMLDSLHMEAVATMHHIASTPWTNRVAPGKKIYAQGSFEKFEHTDHIPSTPEALKAHIRDDSVRKLYPGMVVVPGGWIPDQDRVELEKDFVILDESHPLDERAEEFHQRFINGMREMPSATKDVSPEVLEANGHIPFEEKHMPELVSVAIGNGDKIHKSYTAEEFRAISRAAQRCIPDKEG